MIVDLCRNELGAVPSRALAGLASLTALDLSGNPVRSLGPHCLRELHRLQLLAVRDCPRLAVIQVVL